MKSVRIRIYSGPHIPRIRSEYWEILNISIYSARMRKNADQNNSEHGHFSRSAIHSLGIKTKKYSNNNYSLKNPVETAIKKHEQHPTSMDKIFEKNSSLHVK